MCSFPSRRLKYTVTENTQALLCHSLAYCESIWCSAFRLLKLLWLKCSERLEDFFCSLLGCMATMPFSGEGAIATKQCGFCFTSSGCLQYYCLSLFHLHIIEMAISRLLSEKHLFCKMFCFVHNYVKTILILIKHH